MRTFAKQHLHSANKKGFLYLFEILFVFIIVLSFVIGYNTVNTKIDHTKLINYYKFYDVLTISVAEQLDVNKIRGLIVWYLPNSDYVIKDINKITNSVIEEVNNITGKKDCYSKTIPIWVDDPIIYVTKKTIFVKICF